MGAKYELRGNVAVITLANPPVNGLGYDTRREFAECIDRAMTDAAVVGVMTATLPRSSYLAPMASPHSGSSGRRNRTIVRF